MSTDLNMIRSWGANILISLMEEHEFPLLGVSDFMATLSQAQTDDFKWLHLPIQDMQIPAESFEAQWAISGPEIHACLQSGGSVVIHCRGGLGRTGLLAARILVEFGIRPVDAVARVRQARERSIETYSQEHYVLTHAWEK